MARLVHVAVGVVLDNCGNVLIAKRPDNSDQGGLWEFPGGKLEQGECVLDALKRELKEELAIDIITTESLITIRHDYGDKVVLLDVHKVTEFTGQPQGNEGQPIQWVPLSRLSDYQFPAANRVIIAALNLPQRLLITGNFTDTGDFLVRLETALAKGLRMVQLRLKQSTAIPELLEPVAELCNRYSARLTINTRPHFFTELALPLNVGLHLNSHELLACDARPVKSTTLLGASCHTANDIKHAEKIGVDYICLSPVLKTHSHPDQLGMGWDRFSTLVADAVIPVYALGGMTESDLSMALSCGAQGIAAISEWW